MADRPKKSVQKQSKAPTKKIGKTKKIIQKQIAKSKPKPKTSFKKIRVNEKKGKLLKVTKTRSDPLQSDPAEFASEWSQQLISEFMVRCQAQIRQTISENLRPILRACSSEVIAKELAPLKIAVEAINTSISQGIDRLKESIAERIQVMAEIQEQAQALSREESFGDFKQRPEARRSLNTSDSRNEDRFKRIKKSQKLITNKLILSDEDTPTNRELLPFAEKKKRGRKPKSIQDAKNEQDSGTELADTEANYNVPGTFTSADPEINDQQSDSESDQSIKERNEHVDNNITQNNDAEIRNVNVIETVHSDCEKQPVIKSDVQLEINDPEKLPIKEVSMPASNDKCNSNLKLLSQDSTSIIRPQSAEAQLSRPKEPTQNATAQKVDKEDLGADAFNRQGVFVKENNCPSGELRGYKSLVIESKYQHDSDYFSFN